LLKRTGLSVDWERGFAGPFAGNVRRGLARAGIIQNSDANAPQSRAQVVSSAIGNEPPPAGVVVVRPAAAPLCFKSPCCWRATSADPQHPLQAFQPPRRTGNALKKTRNPWPPKPWTPLLPCKGNSPPKDAKPSQHPSNHPPNRRPLRRPRWRPPTCRTPSRKWSRRGGGQGCFLLLGCFLEGLQPAARPARLPVSLALLAALPAGLPPWLFVCGLTSPGHPSAPPSKAPQPSPHKISAPPPRPPSTRQVFPGKRKLWPGRNYCEVRGLATLDCL
jgi:hypothetical protein